MKQNFSFTKCVKFISNQQHTLDLTLNYLIVKVVIFPYIFSGENILSFFNSEAGVHTWHRIPPTEKRGRLHTSTVKVSILDITQENVISINRNDVEHQYTHGTGPGGQAKNKILSCVLLKHKPTNIQVRIDGRHRFQNEKLAWKILEQRILTFYKDEQQKIISADKKSQLNSGNTRIYRVKDDLVVDKISNKKCSLKSLYKGRLDLLK